MKAITLYQPWASLMACDAKRIETRSWPPHGLRPGDKIAIHAGKHFDYEIRRTCTEEPFKSTLVDAFRRGLLAGSTSEDGQPQLLLRDLPLGAIVAVATFTNWYRTTAYELQELLRQRGPRERDFGNYAPDRCAWVFRDIRPLRTPISARGAQGIWEWTPPANLDARLRTIELAPAAQQTEVPA
jgi:hypothetical protein